jgi:hypothetical protein
VIKVKFQDLTYLVNAKQMNCTNISSAADGNQEPLVYAYYRVCLIEGGREESGRQLAASGGVAYYLL